jgi:hypothetical protein
MEEEFLREVPYKYNWEIYVGVLHVKQSPMSKVVWI